MSGFSRRKLLVGGAAAGALGAISFGNPARALVPWTWPSAGSLAQWGSGNDPDQMWDAEADALIADVLARGDVPAINALLWDWERNDQPLPAGLPADVHDWMERARQLPPWADRAKLDAAEAFNAKYGFWLNLLNALGGGMMATAIPNEARSVYYSAGGANMEDRVAKTSLLGFAVGSQNAYDPNGKCVTQAVKTRMVHSAVRTLLPQSPHWGSEVPITQEDFLVTWHTLPTYSRKKMIEWGVRVSPNEWEAYLHSWQVTAYMLGFAEEFIPATWDAAYTQYDQIMARNMAPTPEGVKLTDVLLDQLAAQTSLGTGVSRPLANALARHIAGDQVADWDAIPREPVFEPMVRAVWPWLVATRNGVIWLPLVPTGARMIDDALKAYILFYLTKGQGARITIPTGNNPNYPDNSNYH